MAERGYEGAASTDLPVTVLLKRWHEARDWPVSAPFAIPGIGWPTAVDVLKVHATSEYARRARLSGLHAAAIAAAELNGKGCRRFPHTASRWRTQESGLI
jgi:hypothetical protein